MSGPTRVAGGRVCGISHSGVRCAPAVRRLTPARMSPATAHAATTVACAAGRLTPPARHEPPDGAPARVITTARDGGQRATIGLQTLGWSGSPCRRRRSGEVMAPDARLRIIDKPWDGYAKPPDQGETQVAQFPEKYDVEAPLLDPHDVSRTFE